MNALKDLITASQALLIAQTLMDHTTVLVILDTWGMERRAAGLKVRLCNSFTSYKVDIITELVIFFSQVEIINNCQISPS